MNINDLKKQIDEYLKEYFSLKEKSYSSSIYDAMEYSINIGGKRVRPMLMLLSYYIYNKDYNKILDASVALEMIHTYSLIHDDLPCMDNDDLRRGMPTSHKKYGEAIAVLAGDALLNEAMNILFDFSLKYGEEALQASKVIANAAGADGMIAGQIVDIKNEGNAHVSVDELNYMHLKKTGELITAAVVAGGILAKAPKEDIELLRIYGNKLGLAFQIKDDILDVTSTTEVLGKKIKSDIENNKTTYVSLFGIEKCEKLNSDIIDDCIRILGDLNGNIEPLRELTLALLKRKY